MNTDPDLQSPLLHLTPSEMYMARENLLAELHVFGPIRLDYAAHALCRTVPETHALVIALAGAGLRIRTGGLHRMANWLVYKEGELIPPDEPLLASF